MKSVTVIVAFCGIEVGTKKNLPIRIADNLIERGLVELATSKEPKKKVEVKDKTEE